MKLNNVIRGRRSVRSYKDNKISKNTIYKLIDAARWAPSACNHQNWHFVIVDKEETLEKLYKSGAEHVVLSPISIFVFYDYRWRNERYKDHIQSASAAIQNLILRAYELGIGSCWVCDLPKQSKIKKILNIPWRYDLIAQINIGYPKNIPKPKPRKDLYEIFSFNRYEDRNKEPSLSRCVYLYNRAVYVIRLTMIRIRNFIMKREEFNDSAKLWKFKK